MFWLDYVSLSTRVWSCGGCLNLDLGLPLPLLFLLIGGIALTGAAVYIDQGRLRRPIETTRVEM